METSDAVRGRVEALRQLLPLDLTTPLLAFLVSDGAIYGIVTQIEDAQPMSYADRNLVRLFLFFFLTKCVLITPPGIFSLCEATEAPHLSD